MQCHICVVQCLMDVVPCVMQCHMCNAVPCTVQCPEQCSAIHVWCSAMHLAVPCVMQCPSQCSALLNAVPHTIQCPSQCSAFLSSVPHTMQCPSQCSTLCNAVPFSMQCISHCSAPYNAVPHTMQCPSQCSAFLYAVPHTMQCPSQCSALLNAVPLSMQCPSQCPAFLNAVTDASLLSWTRSLPPPILLTALSQAGPAQGFCFHPSPSSSTTRPKKHRSSLLQFLEKLWNKIIRPFAKPLEDSGRIRHRQHRRGCQKQPGVPLHQERGLSLWRVAVMPSGRRGAQEMPSTRLPGWLLEGHWPVGFVVGVGGRRWWCRRVCACPAFGPISGLRRGGEVC